MKKDKKHGKKITELLNKLNKERDKVAAQYPEKDLKNEAKLVKMKKDVYKRQILIKAPNGKGKSTILSALVWAIYGKNLKGVSEVTTWEKVRPDVYKRQLGDISDVQALDLPVLLVRKYDLAGVGDLPQHCFNQCGFTRAVFTDDDI